MASTVEYNAVCAECKRSNFKRLEECGGFGRHCPLAIIDELDDR